MSSGEDIVLTIDWLKYNVLRFDYEFNRRIDVLGRPNTMVLGGEIHVVIESTECTDILEQMALKTIPPIRGSIKVYSIMDYHCVKHIEFETAYITRYHERMTAEGKEPMVIELSISATRLDVNQKIFLDRRCPQTKGFYWEPYKHPQPVKRRPAPPEEKQEEAKECTVLFRRSAKEEYDGSFGFDWLRTGDTGEKGCEWYRNLMWSVEQYDLLAHSEYKFFNQRWRENYDKYRAMSKYVIPWVTLMEDQTARFRIKMEVEQPSGPLELKVTGAKEALSLNLTCLDGDVVGNYFYHTELEVTCTSRFSVETAIEVWAGDELVGKMIFVPNNKVYEIDIDIVTVETLVDGRKTSMTPSEDELDRLRKMLQQVYVVPHFTFYTLDLTEKPKSKDIGDGKHFMPLYETIADPKLPILEIEDKGKTLFEILWKLNTGHKIYKNSTIGTKGFGSIHAYFNHMFKKRYPKAQGDYALYFINEIANCGGVANEEEKAACVFKENYNDGSSTTMHELLHCFEILHPFDEKGTYIFRKFHTDNIMDYVYESINDKTPDKKISLWYWQIKAVWNHLKKLKKTIV